MPFLDSKDVANRALQLCGVNQILDVSEDSTNNVEAAFAYDKMRRVELRRNVWRFAVKKTVLRALSSTTLTLVPALYSSTATYLPGEIVRDANGLMWISVLADNTGNTPGGNNEYWDAYFGPMTADLWDSGTTYDAGELVYLVDGTVQEGYQLYVSLSAANSDTPNTATAWDATVQYKQDDVVSYSGSQWRSLIAVNENNTPADGAAPWASATTYSSGNQVTGSNAHVYTSAVNGNVGNDPTTDSGTNWTDAGTVTPWTRSPTITPSSINWRAIKATLENVFNIYPVGSGPCDQTGTRNVYRLPAGYLRVANQNPRAGLPGPVGAPTASPPLDWEFDGNFLVSAESGNIIFRFVADITTVRQMDDMFCEGLACRVAAAIANRLTRSNADLASIASQYKLFMGEARTVNAIESGPEDSPEDDFIVVRA